MSLFLITICLRIGTKMNLFFSLCFSSGTAIVMPQLHPPGNFGAMVHCCAQTVAFAVELQCKIAMHQLNQCNVNVRPVQTVTTQACFNVLHTHCFENIENFSFGTIWIFAHIMFHSVHSHQNGPQNEHIQTLILHAAFTSNTHIETFANGCPIVRNGGRAFCVVCKQCKALAQVPFVPSSDSRIAWVPTLWLILSA